MKICKYCNTENTDSTSTCSSCGAKEFYYRCNNCASEVKNGKFCPNCGVKIGTKPKKCPNCNSEYYSNACPNCGYIKTNQNNAVAKKTYAGDANEIVPETERKKTGCLNVLIAYMAAVISMIIFFKGGFGLFWIILMIILVLYGSSITYKSNYCFNCKKPKSKSAKKCPYCNHSDERVIPFGLSIIVFIGFAILFFIFFASDFNPNDEKYIGNESSSSDNTVTSEIDTITNTNYIDSTYKNELSWVLPTTHNVVQ